MEGVKGYFGSGASPSKGSSEGKKSGSFVRLLTKTALLGGIIATSYYLGKDSKKPRGVVSKILKRPRVNKAMFDECVLHCYDHSPLCIRVELALAFLGVPYTRKLYNYGDVEGPRRLKGKKQLPVLEHFAGKTADSRDIIDLLDKNTSHRSIPAKTNRRDIDDWLRDSKKVREGLIIPRIIKVPVKDWEDIEDARFAKDQFERDGFKYREAKARTAEYLKAMNKLLEEFNEKQLYDAQSVNEFGFGMDDILVIPHLRSLTCVKGLKWPAKLRKYLENAFEDVKAELYFKYEID